MAVPHLKPISKDLHYKAFYEDKENKIEELERTMKKIEKIDLLIKFAVFRTKKVSNVKVKR